MSRLILTDALPDDYGNTAIVVFDNLADPVEKVVWQELSGHGYEGDEVLYLLATDGWAELAWDDGLLTADVVAYPGVMSDHPGILDGLPERSARDPQARRLLRVSASCPDRPSSLPDADDWTVALWSCEPGASDDDIVQAIQDGEDWPVIVNTGPEH